MSRSYKKTPYCGDRKSRFMKRLSNKKIRRHDRNFRLGATSARANYKRVVDSWDICDYCDFSSWKEFQKWTDWRYTDKKKQLKDYKKMYIYK